MAPRKLVWSHVVCALLAAGIPVLVIYVSGMKPRDRPFFIFDARISYPAKSSTFKAPVCIAVSAALAIIQILTSEFYLVTSPGRWLRTLQAILNLIAAFAYQIFVQQLSAFVAGKQRPDFITTCKPDLTAYTDGLLRDSPVQDYALYTSVCTTDADIKDHLKSFPSGHASSTACITFFGMVYFTYSYYVRRKLGATELREGTALGRFWGDLKLGLMGVAMFAQFFWIWMVGVSRYTDNKHGVDDVNSGWYLGTVFAVWGVWETFSYEHRLALVDAQQNANADPPPLKAVSPDTSLEAHSPARHAHNGHENDRDKPVARGGASASAAELGEAKAPASAF